MAVRQGPGGKRHARLEDEALRQQFLDEAQRLWPVLKGSLAQIRKPCIPPACPACARGAKHPAFILSFTQRGRRRCMYVPADLAPLLQTGLRNGRQQKTQNVFREHADRLYHWAKHPDIPAENNRAERELRPLVIARKISFGSQSERGLHTREALMSVLHTLRKRTADAFAAFLRALDGLAENESRDPYSLLFDSS